MDAVDQPNGGYDRGVDTPARIDRLTARDMEVALLWAEGLTVNQSANALGIAPGTVAGIRRRIRRKLAMPSRARLDWVLGPSTIRDELLQEPRRERPTATA